MTREERFDLVAKFESAYGLVDELISGLNDEALRFVPPIAEAWSINDFLVHLLDADASLNFRIRGAIAEPGLAVPLWDEEAWHEKLHYEATDGRRCLELAKGLRASIAQGLRALADEEWSAANCLHPVRGRMDLAALLAVFRDHVAFHASLIKRNKDAWLARKA